MECFPPTGGVAPDCDAICDRHGAAETGLRYCRGCDDFVSLDLFPRVRRPGYACRKHVTAFGGAREHRKKRLKDPDTKRRAWQWKMCYNDAKKFSHDHIGICEKDIDFEITKIDKTKSSKFTLMPLEIENIISTKNCVVVTLEQRKNLMKLVNETRLDEYATIVTELRGFYT